MSDHYDRHNGMNELISREAVKEMMKNHQSDFSTEKDYRTARACANAVPPAEPKKMQWNKKMSIRHINGAVCYIPKWHCPNCDLEYDPVFAQRVNFCYACGQGLEGLVNVVNEVTE